MTRDELREKVAREICQEKCAFRGEPACWKALDDSSFTFPPETCCEPGCVAEASAAIAIVLEEAARVAEEASFQFINTPTQVEIVDVRHTIAAAIRALSK